MVSKDIMKTLYNPYNKDGSIDTSSFVHLKIQDNKNRQQLSSDQSLALLSNLDKTNYNIGFLNQNKEIAEQELSNIELNNKLDNMPDTIKKVSSDPAFWNAIYEYTDDTRKVNKVFENQLEYSKKNFLQKVYHDTLYQNKMHEVYELSGEINRVEREGGDTTELKNQRAALKMEAENMLHATEQSIASSAGSFASSMWQTKETIAAQAGIGLVTKGPVGAVIGGTVGAVGGYIQTKGIERNAMLDALEEVEGLTPQEKYDIADTYSTYSSVIEMAGWNLGVGKMTVGLAKGLRNLFVKEGKEGVSKLIKKMTTREGFLDVMKSVGTDVAISGSSEATEEVVQNEISDVVKTLDPQKIKDMGAKEHYELSKAIFKKTYDTALEIAKGIVFGDKMSDHAKEQLSTWLYTFAGSAVFGGPSAVVSTIGKANAHNNNIEAMEKAGIPEMLEGKENLRKTKEVKELIKSALNNKSPKAFDEIFKRIAEANGAEGKVIISADALSEAINNSENKDEIIGILKDNGVIDALNNAVDGKIELDYATAKNTIFSDELEDIYNQIIGDIAWDSKTMTPNEATTKFTNNITSKLSNVATEKVKELEDKLLTSMKGKGAKEKQLAHANAVMAWHAANALHNANPERSLEDYLNEVVSNLTVGDKGIDVDRVIQSTLRQGDESTQLVQKMNDIDRAEAEAGVPMWDKDTIEINGVERAVTNSAGERIAQSEKSLRMFYEWFGDSTVVDAEGRPLVVYHGTRQPNIREFKAKYDDKLIFFAYKKEFADNWATHAPLTPEQEEEYHNLYRDEDYENFRKDLNRKIKEKYGENWDKSEDSDFIDKILKEYSESKKEFINNKLGIKETTMPVYLKAESTFIPSEHWEWVIDEIEKYYDKDFRDENADDQTKSYMNQIKNGKWIFFEHKNVMDKIRKLGFDSIQLEELSGQGITTIAVFEGNNQIKSTSNRGTYSESENIYYQPGYVSMKTELVGDYLDADRFEGTGEGYAAHGWGNYALQDRETNKINYYSWMSKEELFFGDKAIDFIGNNKYFAPYKAILVGINNNWGKDTIADAIKTQINHNKEEIERFEKELKTINVTEKEWEKWQELLAERDLLSFFGNKAEDRLSKNKEIENLLKGREDDFREYDWFVQEIGNLRESIRVAEEALERVENNFDDFQIKRTGAQYEVDVPEDKYLLDLDKKFSKQSAYVKQKLADVVNDLPKTLDEKKLRTIAGDEIGSSSENWKTYYGKKMFFAGKERALELIHNDQEGDLERELTDFINNLKIEDITSLLEIENKTGREVYNDITNLLGTQKAASKFLEQHGIKGNRYDGQRDGIGYVIFNGADAPIIQRLLQTSSKVRIAGSFDYKTLEIKLTSASNPTTFAHELMHYFMFNMVTYYNNGTMTEEWRKQFEKAMKWAGAEKDANGMYSFDASDPKVRAAQEKLAEGFTSYLLKGEAPSQSTRGLFSTFKTWFKAVYAMLRMKKVRLNQDVTRFYDKIFSVDGDVEMLITQEKLGMMEKPEGVSDEQWSAYQKAKEDAKDAANSEALKIIAKRTKLQTEQAYKDVFDKFFKEKLEELKEDPAYAARAEMLRVKVSKESIERVAGEGKLDKRFIATDKDIANPESEVIGEDIEVLANKFGFGENILEFIDWVNNADSEKVTAEEYAREMADAWIDENYPELREVSPEHALRNIAAMKVNIYEYMILNKIPFNQFNMIFNEMTKTVESMCATMSSKELANSEKLERRLKSVLDKIISLQNTNTTKGLASLKYRAAMLNYMIDISKAARNKRIRFAKKFNKYRKFPTNANLRNIDGQAWNLILDILYKYKMTSRHTASPDIEGRLQEFIEHVLDNGYSSIEDIKGYEDILINENGVSADTMPFGDFVILDGVLRDIEAAGKTLKKIVAKEESLALEDAENQIKDYADKNGIRARSSEDKGINKMKNWWMNGVSIMETQLSELMPTELFKKYILPFFNGMNLAIEWKNNTSKRIMEIIKPVLQKQSRLIRVAGHQLTVLEGLVIMLNAGNKHNLKCMAQTLFEKKGIETDINQIIQELPSAIRGAGVEVDIRDVAQSVWDIFEETAPAMKEAQRQLNGREVNLIQATPITFADGKTIRGGYYPAKGTDYTGDVKNIKDTSNFIQKTFSFTLDRTGQVHGDLPLDLTMLTSWVGQIGKLMFVSNPANNIMKLTNSKLIESAWGDERIKSVKEWLALSISPEAIDPLIAKASSLGSVLILGGNIAKIFVQMLGFTAAIAYTGFHIIPSLIKCMTLVGWRSGYNNAKSKSAYIRNRYSDPLNHLYNAKSVENIFADAGSKGYDRAMKVFMSAVTLGDNFAATVVWDAVYNKSINEGMTEQDAILSADSAVRRTQGDTSHGSRPKAIQGWKRLLSPFCSYFLAVHNIVTAKMQHGDAKSKLEATIMLAMYGIVVPYIESILSSYVNYYGYSDEDKRKKRIKDIVSFRKDSQAENMITSSFNILLPVGGVASYPSAVALRAFDQQGFINPTVIPHEPIIKLTKVLLAIVDEAKGKDSADIMKEVEKLFGVDKILRSGRSIENIKDNLFN